MKARTKDVVGGEMRNIPIPDPSERTEAAIERAISNLHELIGTRLVALSSEIETVRENVMLRPAAITAEIAHQRDVIEEKFEGVEERFNAIAAAAEKAEKAFTKQLDGMSELLSNQRDNTNDKIEDLRNRLTASDTRVTTKADSTVDQRSVIMIVVTVIGTAIAVLGVVWGMVPHSNASAPTSPPVVIAVPASSSPGAEIKPAAP